MKRMRTITHECRKAFTSPILIVLILCFMIYNIFLILDRSGDVKKELTVAKQLAETYGLHITDQSLQQFREDVMRGLTELNQITGQQYSSVYEFFNDSFYQNIEHYNEQERDFFTQLRLKEMYADLASRIDKDYEQMDWEKIGEGIIEKFRFSGNAAETIRNEYMKISQRFAEMKANEEHKTWFFAGNPYRMHSFLFRTIFGHLIFESLIVIVLTTALITNFEFEHKTHLLTYTTKRGRKLMRDKLVASLLTGTTVTIFLVSVTLGAYFLTFDYSPFWGSSISSAFNWEYELPYVSKWPMTVAQFLLWNILLVYVTLMLFTAITFVISVFVKNNYFTFFLFAIFFAIAYLAPFFMPAYSNSMLIAGHNLSQLMMNPHMFFMGNIAPPMMFKHYEWITIVIWSIVVMTCSGLALKTFRQQDID